MYKRASEVNSYALGHVPDHFKTQEILNIETVEVKQWQLYAVPDHFKIQEICEGAVEESPCTLEQVPDHFKTPRYV